MKILQDAVAVISFSIAALLCFHLIPEFGGDSNISSITQYGFMAAAFYYFIHAYTLPSLRYFRLPSLSFLSISALFTAGLYAFLHILTDKPVELSFLKIIEGFLFLLAIAAGEELVSRGFIFGILQKYGIWVAVIFSSLTFGLMHLNVYLGDDWDPIDAYFHVVSTFGFGLLASALMIATRSILPAIALHTAANWSLVFEASDSALPIEEVAEEPWTILEILDVSFFTLIDTVPFALSIFAFIWLDRHARIPRWLKRTLIKFKLAVAD